MRLLPIAALLPFCLPAIAQQSEESARKTLRDGPPGQAFALASTPTERTTSARSSLLRTDPASVRRFSAAQMGLFAGENEQRATLTLAFDFRSDVAHNLQFTLSAPWNDNGDTEIASLDGLSGATRLDTSYQRLFAGSVVDGFSIDASVGYQEFEFFDAAAEGQSVRKTEWAAGFKLTKGWDLNAARGTGQRLLVAYSRESGYESDAASAGLICEPLTGNMQRCEEGFLAPPRRDETDKVSVELRWVATRFGVAPKIVRDLEQHVTGAELPVYLVRGPTVDGVLGMLNGGIKAAWRSDSDDFTLGLFVGANLSLD